MLNYTTYEREHGQILAVVSGDYHCLDQQLGATWDLIVPDKEATKYTLVAFEIGSGDKVGAVLKKVSGKEAVPPDTNKFIGEDVLVALLSVHHTCTDTYKESTVPSEQQLKMFNLVLSVAHVLTKEPLSDVELRVHDDIVLPTGVLVTEDLTEVDPFTVMSRYTHSGIVYVSSDEILAQQHSESELAKDNSLEASLSMSFCDTVARFIATRQGYNAFSNFANRLSAEMLALLIRYRGVTDEFNRRTTKVQ